MSHKTLIRVAGVVGGLCWLAQAAVNDYAAAENAVNALYWGGGVLILVALVGLGAGLVSGAPWLRLVVGLCVPLLVWSILSILHAEAPDSVVDGGFGLAPGADLRGLAARRCVQGRPSRPPAAARTPSSLDPGYRESCPGPRCWVSGGARTARFIGRH